VRSRSYTARMASKDLDRIDRSILEILQREGRITNQELSERVALSPRACLERMRRLERGGLITGYMALVEPRRLGSLLTIMVEVTLKDQTQATHARFEQRMRNSDEVVECFLVSGPCDYVLRLACRDLDHYRELTNAWTDDPTLGVEKIASKPELQTIKPFRGYPLA
jgi:Lrp/AsnC family transcriptional regulator, leucine-responsive regulatory protein